MKPKTRQTMEENLTNEMPEITPPEQLPHAPEFLKSDKWFDIDIDNDFLDFEEPYSPPRYTLSRFGIPFANVGELHIISGKPGHGKTGLMSQLMATLLCGKFGNMEYILNKERPKPVVLYIDTEQGKDDTIAIKNRVCSLAGLPHDKPLDQFKILRLRDTEDAKDRWRKVLKAIYIVKPTDIFLDGLLDIVKDYNDQVECQPIIRECMMTATHYDASLWTVLHENPMVDKLVGTLGSIAQRKVAEIFTVKKTKQGDLKPADRRLDRPDIYFTVKQVKARGRDVADWDFEYQQNTGGWGMPVELNDNSTQDGKNRSEIAKADEIFRNFKWTSEGGSRTDLDTYLNGKGISSHRDQKRLYDLAKDEGIIYQSENRKYHYNGLNNQIPNDKAEDIPFDPVDDEDKPPF